MHLKPSINHIHFVGATHLQTFNSVLRDQLDADVISSAFPFLNAGINSEMTIVLRSDCARAWLTIS
jgi:hypothetical protein